MSLPFAIIHQDDDLFIIDKPQGFFVHPPEASPYPVPREKICLHLLRDYFRAAVFPVHRLDAATSGLVTFAFSKERTRELSLLFSEREVKKTYWAVARGYLPEAGAIELPLEIKGFGELQASRTEYRLMKTIELPYAVGRYSTARYSWAEVSPITGRWRQIRRHFDRIAHPLLGDQDHGDTHHNRLFRDKLHIKGLCLRAISLSFRHPATQEVFTVHAPPNPQWLAIENLFRL